MAKADLCLKQGPGKMVLAARTEEPELSLELLPSHPLVLIFSFLDYRDLVSCSYVSQHLNHLSNHDPLWKRHCEKYWLLTEADQTQKNKSWKSLFKDTYIDKGRYIHHYATLKKAWDDLERYLGLRCPRMIACLNDGVKEQELDTVEAQIGYKLPNDYRCSLLIHNGQRLVDPGLMGSMAIYDHYRSECLLDINTAVSIFQQRQGLRHCLPLTYCFHTRLSQDMALESLEGCTKYEIFYQHQDQRTPDPSAIEIFFTSASYSQWFASYVHNVVTGGYPIIREEIFRYVHDQECVTTTGDITVSVSTAFLPERSSVHNSFFYFTYLIRIEMAEDALPEKTCQLDSSFWRLAQDNSRIVEDLNPGVLGRFPILSPGQLYEYTSCAIISTSSGYMEGHYTFHLLCDPDIIFNVEIPRFHITCPFFKVSTAPIQNLRRRRFSRFS